MLKVAIVPVSPRIGLLSLTTIDPNGIVTNHKDTKSYVSAIHISGTVALGITVIKEVPITTELIVNGLRSSKYISNHAIDSGAPKGKLVIYEVVVRPIELDIVNHRSLISTGISNYDNVIVRLNVRRGFGKYLLSRSRSKSIVNSKDVVV